MNQEPYYGCSGGCANCPRRQSCLAAAQQPSALPGEPVDNVPAAESGNTTDAVSDASLDAFLKANPAEGTVRIQAFRGDQAIPVENVRVVISRLLGGEDHVFFQGSTDASGIIDPIVLPAPAKASSLSPGLVHPYATYDLRTDHVAFLPLNTTVDVYQNVKTVQPVPLRLRLE